MNNPKSKIQNPKFVNFPLRLLAYLLLIGLMLFVEVRLVLHYGYEPILLENGLVEWASVAVCVLSLLLFLGIAVRDGRRRRLALLLGCLALAPCIRETDLVLARIAFKRFHYVLLFLLFLVVVWIVILLRRSLWEEVKAFLYRPAFVLMVFGLVIVVFWAEVLGRRELWGYFGRVYPMDFNGVKCMVEETLELVGYILVFFGAIEELLGARATCELGKET